jgi:Sec-independent protein secretion pathway component TatC
MFILAVPLYMLFEGGLVLMRLTWKPPVAHEDNAVEVEQT